MYHPLIQQHFPNEVNIPHSRVLSHLISQENYLLLLLATYNYIGVIQQTVDRLVGNIQLALQSTDNDTVVRLSGDEPLGLALNRRHLLSYGETTIVLRAIRTMYRKCFMTLTVPQVSIEDIDSIITMYKLIASTYDEAVIRADNTPEHTIQENTIQEVRNTYDEASTFNPPPVFRPTPSVAIDISTIENITRYRTHYTAAGIMRDT